MNYSIVAEQVCKQFKDNLALDNVDLKVESGSICGLVGRNGSGKTVLMKCICGLMPLTSGKIIVNGKTIGMDAEIPESVGVIIETPGFLTSFSAYSNLKFLADISGKADKQGNPRRNKKRWSRPGQQKARRQILPRNAPAAWLGAGNNGGS